MSGVKEGALLLLLYYSVSTEEAYYIVWHVCFSILWEFKMAFASCAKAENEKLHMHGKGDPGLIGEKTRPGSYRTI